VLLKRVTGAVAAAVLVLGLVLGLPAGRPVAGPASAAASPDDVAPVVLEPVVLDAAGSVTSAGLARVLAPLLGARELGPSVGAAVLDPASGQLLYGKSATTGLVPASTTKILTAVTALATVGPDVRLTTKVVSAPPATTAPPTTAPAADIVLVGGGDPTLTVQPSGSRALGGYPDEARLDLLAGQTAGALRAQGVSSVRLRYDDSLFDGPVAARSWAGRYVVSGEVARITALTVDEARVRPYRDPRVRDPSYDAAQRFARLLVRGGIAVRGRPAPGAAPQAGRQLAAVDSAPLATLVERMLSSSDNDLAEALARHAARAAGHPATFDGAATAIVETVGGLGVDVSGVRLYDGSGLSRANRIPPAAIAQTLAVAASAEHPELRATLTGLAVAGFDGTLDDRFLGSPARRAVGLVRAKTGTLTGVSALAGVVPDADGNLLVFSFTIDRIPAGGAGKVRGALDAMAAAIGRCGCG